ncbi:hypothetical protein ACFQ21_14080 [Ohtaekwangia kribbensis]|uniref:Uncharacterized protein n=1 Tax=Ohtaekwangia kribbensis TaxID=688913 RepID=A0ABW3K3D0_9BACT
MCEAAANAILYFMSHPGSCMRFATQFVVQYTPVREEYFSHLWLQAYAYYTEKLKGINIFTPS